MMYRIGSPGINIERNAKLFKGFFDYSVIFIHHLLRCNSFFFCFDGDGYAMFIASADKKYILAFGAQIANIDIGRNIYTGKVSDMNRPISIRQGRGNGISFELMIDD